MSDQSALPKFRSLAEMSAAMAEADVAPEKLEFDEKGTIICQPKKLGAQGEIVASASASATLASGFSLPILTGQGPDSEILVVGELSRGGMGKVMRAEQSSLGREVAIKVAKPGEGERGDLVVEARVAGRLEHPNIVPVHILGQNADGAPIIVMKKIDGRSFKDLLAEGSELSRDIEILMDVCRALHFAHAHGVVHRDAKPANIMVGQFGEVYLLDWGVAIGFGDKALPDLPHVSDGAPLVGTPHYMAPEMAFSGGIIDQRTDVFLVGAMLCEILTGKPPHARATIEETLFAAHSAEMPDLSGAPEELAEICKRCLQRDPALRYQSAEDLRLALARFQSHAAARQLCEDGEKRLTHLENGTGDDRTFAECRFAFTQAMRTWPESTRARNGLVAATAWMARREIAAGHYDSAKLLVSELENPPAAIVAELEGLRARKDKEAADVSALQSFAAEHDSRIAEKERAWFVIACGVVWLVLLSTVALLDRADVFHAGGGTFAVALGIIAVFTGALYAFFPRVRENTASRALLTSFGACAVAIALVHAVGWWFAVDKAPLLACGDTVLATTGTAVAANDRRLWPGVLLIGLIAPAIMLWPDAAYMLSGVGSFLGLVVVGLIWRRGT